MLTLIRSLALSLFWLTYSSAAFAKLPDEVMDPYKAYRAALEKSDNILAKKKALEAWEAAEKLLGDHKATGDLAINYASVSPSGNEKNRYKNYQMRAKAFNRGIELSHFYGEEAGTTEVERRIALADLDLTVWSYRYSQFGMSGARKKRSGNISSIRRAEKAVEEYGLEGTTSDGDVNVLYTRYYQLNGDPEKAIQYGEKALNIYADRTDGLVSKHFFNARLFKGYSHSDLADKTHDIDQKIKAALEFQVVMQNVKGGLPADHAFVKIAFRNWMKARSDIEEAGMLDAAEKAGLCECWPYQNYKDKAVPLKRVPPEMPSSASASGHVNLKFDVDDDGRPENIAVVSSSNPLFEASAVKSVESWEYSKLQPNADAKNRKDISVTIRYRLTNRSGNIIPEQ